MSVSPHFEGYEIIEGSGSGDGVVVGDARPGGVSAGGRLQLGDGQGGAGGLRGAAVLQRVLAVAAHDTPRHASRTERRAARAALANRLAAYYLLRCYTGTMVTQSWKTLGPQSS